MPDTLSNAINFAVNNLPKEDSATYFGIKKSARKAVLLLKQAMFPAFSEQQGVAYCGDTNVDVQRNAALSLAAESLIQAMLSVMDEKTAVEKTASLIRKTPEIARILQTDIDAAYEGDPAAKSKSEVALAYPSFPAICIYRIAHALYEDQVPLIPRIMTEYGHEITGIDIHPGATIGPYFFIDHGTGVVIGETTTIADHVKIYQHVTLGAKSFKVNDDGSLVKGIKRHPDIGSHVVIYAGATILGGETKIGDNCIIGGNIWLTRSVDAGTTVVSKPAEIKRI
ncbi:MAG: serine acetyltransferase [Sphaerochaetaceae bacterium]|nr:serine acetyltransferase [Sphaerochaetaceae bacterium]